MVDFTGLKGISFRNIDGSTTIVNKNIDSGDVTVEVQAFKMVTDTYKVSLSDDFDTLAHDIIVKAGISSKSQEYIDSCHVILAIFRTIV